MSAFLEALRQGAGPDEVYQKALAVLDEFCKDIDDYTNHSASCERERGYVTEFGQEWRVVLRASEGGRYPQVMFRAYVPAGGFPVQLDLHETGLTSCEDEPALRKQLEDFVRDPNVHAQIVYYSKS